VIAGIITAVMLLGTTAISTLTTAESVFAYRNNQATSQVSDCGNGFEPTNVGCQNTASQIQGDKNTVALSAQQTFPPGAPPCVGFDILTSEQRADFEELIPSITGDQASTIKELCAYLETLDPLSQEIIIGLVARNLERIGVDSVDIVGYLRSVLGLPL
jgi:hypothetical protein